MQVSKSTKNNHAMSLTFYLSFFSIFFLSTVKAEQGWFCQHAASEKNGNSITSCGIGEAAKENEARKKALESALEEFDTLCERSIDCKSFETIVEPNRNDCQKIGKSFKCYRAITATITKTKRKEVFAKGKSKEEVKEKDINITVKIEGGEKVAVSPVYTPEPLTEKEQCYKSSYDISEAMKFASGEKADALILETTKLALMKECLEAHQSVIEYLLKNKKRSTVYEDYLNKKLDSPSLSMEFDLYTFIFDYARSFEFWSEKLFQSLKTVVFLAPKHRFSNSLSRLFDGANLKLKDHQLKEAQIILEEGRKPINFNLTKAELFTELLMALAQDDSSNLTLSDEFYKKNKSILKAYKSKMVLETFLRFYQNADKGKPKALSMIKEYVSGIKMDQELAEELFDYIMDENEQKAQGFIKEMNAVVLEALSLTSYDQEKKNNLCQQFKLSCQGNIKQNENFLKDLESTDLKRRLQAISTMKNSAKLEESWLSPLFAALSDSPHQEEYEAKQILEEGSPLLLKFKALKSEHFEFLMEMDLMRRLSLSSWEGNLPQGFAPLVLTKLKAGNSGEFYALLKILEKVKGLDQNSCKDLNSFKTSTENLHYSHKSLADKILKLNCKG
jgi:hypothetical protein